MDHLAQRDRDSEVDVEAGALVFEQDPGRDSGGSGNRHARPLLAKICGRFIDGSSKGEDGVRSCGSALNSNRVLVENPEVLTSEKMEGAENIDSAERKPAKKKVKKTSNKKPPKPPRPPRGPSLDAADEKLIREIAELAMLKRARIERMKAVKKMKAAKASSSGNMVAMLLTILFCFVLIFQGMSSGSSAVRFPGSLEPAGQEVGLISVQLHPNPAASALNAADSGSPYLVEQVAGSDTQEELRRDVD